MARSAGFEPTTPWFVARYSIQLSYERNLIEHYRVHKHRVKLAVAETEGFEPSIPFLTVCSLSRGVPSTSRPRLRKGAIIAFPLRPVKLLALYL